MVKDIFFEGKTSCFTLRGTLILYFVHLKKLKKSLDFIWKFQI
jgi:hypothetical protein